MGRRPGTRARAATAGILLAAGCSLPAVNMTEIATALAAAQVTAMSTPIALQPSDAASPPSAQASVDANGVQGQGAVSGSTDANGVAAAAGGGDPNITGPAAPTPTDPWLRTFFTTLASVKTDQCGGTCAASWSAAPLAYGFIKAGTQYFLIVPEALESLTADDSGLHLTNPRHAISGAPDNCQASMESAGTFTLNGDNLSVRFVTTTVVSCPTQTETCFCDVQLSGYPKA